MDVAYFFGERMRFIRFYHQEASGPFARMRKAIEDGAPPFDDPSYSEDSEPPFMADWSDADTALVVVGRSCLSMLAASLKLYFDTWESMRGVKWKNGEKAKAWKKGFADGYLTALLGALGISLEDCPADLAVLEQVFLARNRDQHPDSIHSIRVNHSKNDRAKYPQPFFASEHERRMTTEVDLAGIPWLSPAVHVDWELLHRAIREAENLVSWLEPKLQQRR